MISNITKSIINKCIDEFKKEENQDLIQKNIIDPLIIYIIDRFYPYIFFITMIFILMIILMMVIILLIFTNL